MTIAELKRLKIGDWVVCERDIDPPPDVALQYGRMYWVVGIGETAIRIYGMSHWWDAGRFRAATDEEEHQHLKEIEQEALNRGYGFSTDPRGDQ